MSRRKEKLRKAKAKAREEAKARTLARMESTDLEPNLVSEKRNSRPHKTNHQPSLTKKASSFLQQAVDPIQSGSKQSEHERKDFHPNKLSRKLGIDNNVDFKGGRILEDKVFWIDVPVESGKVNHLSGYIECSSDENAHAALVIFDFGDYQVSPEFLQRNRLVRSKIGVYSYLQTEKGSCTWARHIFIPESVSELRLGFRGWENKYKISILKSITVSIDTHQLRLAKELASVSKQLLALLSELDCSESKLGALKEETEFYKLAAAEAAEGQERLKNHLSYQLGYTLIYGFKSVGAFFKLPLALREVQKTSKLRNAQYGKADLEEISQPVCRAIIPDGWTELGDEVLWSNHEVDAKSHVSIIVATRFHIFVTDKKNQAVFLLRCLDENDHVIEVKKDRLGWSKRFGCHFKHLANTVGDRSVIHSFVAPDTCKKVQVGFSLLQVTEGDSVSINYIDVKSRKVDRSRDAVVAEKRLSVWTKLDAAGLSEHFPVKELLSSSISLASEFNVSAGESRDLAVLLFQCFDKEGKPIDFPGAGLAWSKYFKSFFKYLPNSDSSDIAVHSFVAPKGAVSVRLGIKRFKAKDGDSISVRNIELKQQPKKESELFIPPSKQAADISIVEWPQYDSQKPCVIGVMDEFTSSCFEENLNLIQPRPDNWYALAEKYKPVMFFIESAWKGNYGSWQYRVANYATKPELEIDQISQYAKEKGIPCVFWNKEDPVHHDKFMESAGVASHIFTTDANMVNSYVEKTGNKKVFPLPFAAQPALHKPAPLEGRIARSCFAGSWYHGRHPERSAVMGWLLRAGQRFGLDIYDRNFGTGTFEFPEEFHASVKGKLTYKALCEKYSKYRVFLNVNSITDSPTMFSRRVFELMACGTPVVSTYAKGIEELFDSEAVWFVHTEAEAEEAIQTLLTDDKEWLRRSLLGIREVFAKHTYTHRLNYIFEQTGLDIQLANEPLLLFIAKVQTACELQKMYSFIEMQSYKNIRLIIECASGQDSNEFPVPENVSVGGPEYISKVLDQEVSEFNAVGYLSSVQEIGYGENYAKDLVNSMRYEPTADGWGKSLGHDQYVFNQPTRFDCMIWPPEVFIEKWANGSCLREISSPSIFCTDSSEFIIS